MKKTMVWLSAALLLGGGIFFFWRLSRPTERVERVEEITPFYGAIQIAVSTTGVVEPQNRLELKPPIGGRLEEIRVQEGQSVRTGQILALMSSTERAALLDAARLQDPDQLAYWEKVYKATPILAPINGKVIVRAVEPGQTVTSGDAVFVLADRLIVKANVDETDIGRVAKGQRAVISLDAYPDVEVAGRVDHISYESTVINNVTIYSVDLLPERVPDVFRSGMSANIEIIARRKEKALLVPAAAVREQGGQPIVLVRDGSPRGFGPRPVTLGISDVQNVEVVEGLTAEDTVVVVEPSAVEAAPKSNGSSSPLVPQRPRGGGSRR